MVTSLAEWLEAWGAPSARLSRPEKIERVIHAYPTSFERGLRGDPPFTNTDEPDHQIAYQLGQAIREGLERFQVEPDEPHGHYEDLGDDPFSYGRVDWGPPMRGPQMVPTYQGPRPLKLVCRDNQWR